MAFDDGVKTVSGSIAHTDDAATKVPFVSVKCGIEPTLTGVSEVSATQTGENLFDKSAVIDNTWIVVNDTTTESAVGYRTSDYIPVKANTRYYVSTKGSNRTAYYGKNKNGIAYFSFSGGQSFNCLYDGYIRITIKNDIDLDTFIVNEGNTAITYEPYNGTTYTANLGRTIHGGEVDIVNGVGTGEYEILTLAVADMNNSENYPGWRNCGVRAIIGAEVSSSVTDGVSTVGQYWSYNTLGNNDILYLPRGQYNNMTQTDWKTTYPDLVIQFAIKKATPTDFTFTPITPTPETVGKVNNVYCNTGNTEVTYYDNAHGFAEVTVNKTGKNLIDGTKFTRGLPSTTIGASIDTITASNRYAYYGVRAGGGSLTVSSTSSNTDYFTLVLIWGYKNGVLTYYSNAQAGTSKTVDFSNCDYVRIGIGAVSGTTVPTDLTGYGSIQLELGSQATSYEPYEAVSKTAYLHKVIYGGQADVVKGTCKPKNLFDSVDASHTFTSGTNTQYQIGTVALKGGVTYTFSAYQEDALTSNTRNTLAINDNGNYTYEYATGSNYHNQSGVHSMQYTPNADKTVTLFIWVHTPSNDVTYSEFQVEKGSSASDFAPYFEPFTFPPISIGTDEGENTLFANEGASAITYRKAVD